MATSPKRLLTVNPSNRLSLDVAKPFPTINPSFDPGNITLRGGGVSREVSTYRPSVAAPVAAPVANPSPSIPVSTLASTEPVRPITSYTPPPATQTEGLLGTFEMQADTFLKGLETRTNDREGDFADISRMLFESISGTEGKTSLENRLYRQEVDPAEAELRDISQQLLEEQHANRRRLEALKKNERGMTVAGLQAEVDRINNESLTRQADLAVVQLAKQGKFDSAKAIADRAVAATLESQTMRNDALKLAYQTSKDLFTAAEQREFAAAQSERDRALENAEYRARAHYDQLLKQNDPKYQAEVAQLQAEAAGMAGLGTDTATLNAYATEYAATGKLPSGADLERAGISAGQLAQIAKQLPKPVGTIVDSQTGVKSSNVPAAEQADFTALYNIIQNTERLKALDEERWGGVVAGTLGKVFGSDKQAEYLATRKAIIDDLARMQTGAALTLDEQKFYEDYLPGRFSEAFGFGQDSGKKIENFSNIMKNRLQDRASAYGLAVYGFTKVNVGGQELVVGQEVKNADGITGRVLPDGSIAVPDTTASARADLGSLAQSIVQQESGGSYDAVGIPTQHGRALGKYQIIPKFHFAKIGLNPDSPADQQRFLSSPQLQDQLFVALLSELDQTYGGDPAKIAAAYYGGGGAVEVLGTPAGDKPQAGGMPSINSYVRSVLSRA